ncbi:hypothetical protein TNCV_1490841 [Trichonephila clavipes]|nr:hypothetical protein TNCV_1490841 [Trichonephila clavipes]
MKLLSTINLDNFLNQLRQFFGGAQNRIGRWSWSRTRGHQTVSLSSVTTYDPSCREAEAHKICRGVRPFRWRGVIVWRWSSSSKVVLVT